MTFDEKLKARAQREDSPIPKGFDERMDALLHDLPEQVTPIKKRRAPRTAVCIGIAAALVVGAAAAAPTVLEMARNTIGYFTQNSGSEYAEYQGKYEKYNAAVGMSDTNGDQTLTIDNLAVDDSYMLVFYTLKSKTPIELAGTDDEPQSWRTSWTAPTFFAQVNGKQLDTTGAIENEATMPDEYTLTGVHRIVLKEALPDQFDLLLYDSGSSDINDANFQFAMSVDKSTVAVSTKSVTGLRQSFSSRGGAKAAPYIQHTPNVMPCTSRNVSTAGAVSSAPSGRNTNVHAALANVATQGANHRSDITRRPAHTLITHSTSSAAAA